MPRYTCKLTALTPLHVGSGRKLLHNAEYLHMPDHRKVVVLDDKKILNLIGESQLGAWQQTIVIKGDLLRYLKQRMPSIRPEDIAYRIAESKASSGYQQELFEQLHNGVGQPLIPGSTLKGGIRTALLTAMIEQKYGNNGMPDSQLYKEDKGGKRTLDGGSLEKLMGDDPNQDKMRLFQVGDANFPAMETAVEECTLLTYQLSDDVWKKAGRNLLLLETIPAGSSTRFNLSIHEPVGTGNSRVESPVKDFADLAIKMRLHMVNLLGEELKEFREYGDDEASRQYTKVLAKIFNQAKWNDDQSFIMRFGFGSGWKFMTGDWAETEGLVNDNQWYSIKKAVQANRNVPTEDVFPISRKITGSNQPLGFVKVELIPS